MNKIITLGSYFEKEHIDRHSHNLTEIIYCTNGAGYLIFSNDTQQHYQQNDILIIPPDILHENMGKPNFGNIHFLVKMDELKFSKIIKMKDTSNLYFLHLCEQIQYIFNSDLINKKIILNSFADTIINSIESFSKLQKLSPPIEAIRDEIIKNLTNSQFDVNSALSKHNYNAEYLRKLFKEELGVTPLQFIIVNRISYAQTLLTNSHINNYSIADISLECGFENPLYFSRMFKQIVGESPINYKQISIKK